MRSLSLVFENQTGKLYTFASNIAITPAERDQILARFGQPGTETDQKKLTSVRVIDWPF